MKVVFFEVADWEKVILERLLSEQAEFVGSLLTESNAEKYKDAEIISIRLNSLITPEVLAKLPNLRYIVTRSTGFDHIDLAACRAKHVSVSNIPSYGAHTVAEHTFALILSLTKKMIPSVEQTRRGNFSLEGLEGIDLNGKTLGVIGAGNIGTAVIHIARGFGMHVLVYTRHPKPSDNQGIEFIQKLDDVLGQSDIITLHLPLTPETKHIINKKNITQCKKGAYIINTARGGLIETEALLDGLSTKHLAGAGLDVLEDEYDIQKERGLLETDALPKRDMKVKMMQDMLMTMDNVLVTPHKAFFTTDAVEEMLQTTIDNIAAFQQGKPQNVVE